MTLWNLWIGWPKIVLTQRRIAEGAMMPRGYGLAYWDWVYGEAICYPLPLNHLMRWGHALRHIVRFPTWPKLPCEKRDH